MLIFTTSFRTDWKKQPGLMEYVELYVNDVSSLKPASLCDAASKAEQRETRGRIASNDKWHETRGTQIA